MSKYYDKQCGNVQLRCVSDWVEITIHYNKHTSESVTVKTMDQLQDLKHLVNQFERMYAE